MEAFGSVLPGSADENRNNATFGAHFPSLSWRGQHPMASFARRREESIMHQQNGHRRVWQVLSCSLMVGMLVGLAACAPGNTGIIPQGSANATVVASPTCPGAQANSSQLCSPAPASRGILIGSVVAGPTCPVDTAEQPCPPRSVPNRLILIETPGGTVVMRVTTDQQGRFRVTLAPGTYRVLVPQDGHPFPTQRTPQQVRVIAGQTMQVLIELDTGIR
jgi:hypothetical protein